MKRKIWIGGVIAAALILCAAVSLWPAGGRAIEAARAAVVRAAQGADAPGVCPIDFAALQKENPDIYAWLYIPGTGINEPLLQRDGDSSYYLTHDSMGHVDEGGALFTESAYNQTDFTDSATVIYGKNRKPKRLFGSLQAMYSSAQALKEHSEVFIYMPGEAIRYEVFAAAPFRSYHLLHYFNFSNENRFRAFLQAMDSVKTIDANRNRDVTVTPGDQLLILSTTRTGDPSKCYLVLAKRT